jgi:hypothetical protein
MMQVGSSGRSPMPDRFYTSLNYNQLNAITTAGIGVPSLQSFRINSIFDPDLTGVGHQPLGHDEFTPFYTKYTVTGVRYTVTFSNQSTTDYADVAVVLRPNTNGYGLMSTVLESSYCRSAVIGPETGTGNIKKISGAITVAKIRGVPESKVINDNDYSALIGATPALQPTLQIYVENQNTAVAITVNVRTDITYFVQLFDRRVITQS